ncbi:MAG: LysR family transcriptional regulator [Oscillospiraceae bacterium]
MDIHGLEYIIEIGRTRNISRAAANLFITQSNLSQYLAKLEAELGLTLFTRCRNEVIPTPAGKLYIHTAQQIVEEKKELYHRLSNFAESRTGSFSLGITPQWGGTIFASVFPPFHAAYPGISITLIEDTARPLTRALIDGKLDMAIFPLSPGDALLNESTMLSSEELVLAIPAAWSSVPGGILGEQLPVVSLSSLRDRPFILSKTDTTIRRIQDECFDFCKFQPIILSEINNHAASLSLVEQEMGITFIPSSYIHPSPDIVYASCSPRAQWFITVAYRHNFKPQRVESYFLRLVQSYFSGGKAGLAATGGSVWEKPEV